MVWLHRFSPQSCDSLCVPGVRPVGTTDLVGVFVRLVCFNLLGAPEGWSRCISPHLGHIPPSIRDVSRSTASAMKLWNTVYWLTLHIERTLLRSSTWLALYGSAKLKRTLFYCRGNITLRSVCSSPSRLAWSGVSWWCQSGPSGGGGRPQP